MAVCGFFSVFACTEHKKEGGYSGSIVSEKPEFSFTFPDIPTILTSSDEKREYLLKHYWDRFDFADTAIVKKNIIESVFVNHLCIIMQEETEMVVLKECVDNLCSRMEKYPHARRVFMELNDDYLYNPNSQYYNENIYLIYLERMIVSKYLGDAEKSNLIFKRNLIRRNMPGDMATDFFCYLENGRKISLFNTKIKGDYLLLLFYAPECPMCMETMKVMTEDVLLSEAVKKGKLTVFAVYTEGDEKEWRTSCGKLPDEWIKANDRMMILDKALYDLKAMPSLYLLDKEKRVLLKDAPYTVVREALSLL